MLGLFWARTSGAALDHRRPPLLEPLDRLGAETDGRDELDEPDEDGRETPCDELLLPELLVAEPLELDELELDEPGPVVAPELLVPELPEL